MDLSELNQFGDVLGFYGVRLISVYTSLYICSVGLKTPGNGVNSLAIYKIQLYITKFSGFQPSESLLLCTRMLFVCCYGRERSISLLLCTWMFKFAVSIGYCLVNIKVFN